MSETTLIAEKPIEKPAARHGPFDFFDDWSAAMERWLDRGWPTLGRLPFGTRTGRAWTPQIEVFEKDQKLVVRADLPGMKKEDVHVTLTDDSLVIEGERSSDSEVNEEDRYIKECSYGRFYRRLALPEALEAEAIDARFKDGVLEVKLPKAASRKAKGRPVEIR